MNLNNRKFKVILVIFILLVSSEFSFSQPSENIFIRNYYPEQYKANNQNWCIAQDTAGIMYIGNEDGLLEYDGINWKFTNVGLIRSIAINSENTIFVGLPNDFGYMKSDYKGNFKFISLKGKIAAAFSNFSDIWKIHIIDKKVIFQSLEYLFLFENDSFTYIKTKSGYYISHLVNKNFYITENQFGLMKLDKNKLTLIKGSEYLKDDPIFAMIPLDSGKIFIASLFNGVTIYDPNSTPSFIKSETFNSIDTFLQQNSLYCGAELSNNRIALGTQTGGVIIFDKNGKITDSFNSKNGLQDNQIWYLYTDLNKQLWTALGNGISRIDCNLPFKIYHKSQGINGIPFSIYNYNSDFYLGTSQNLQIKAPSNLFEIIPGTEGQNPIIYNFNGNLLLGNQNGCYLLKNRQITLLFKESIHDFCISKSKEFIIAGTDYSLYLLTKDLKVSKIKNYNKGAYKVAIDTNQIIWVSNLTDIYKLKLSENYDSVISVLRPGTTSGLPSDFAEPHVLNSGEIVFATSNGIYQYNHLKTAFQIHPAFKAITGKVIRFKQDENGIIWFEEKIDDRFEKGYLIKQNNTYKANKLPFYKFNTFSTGNFEAFYSFPDSIAYIGTTKGLLEYDFGFKTNYNQIFNTIIRKITFKDSVLFVNNFPQIKHHRIPYSRSNISFYYTAAFYENAEKNVFSYRLIGLDTTWSSWLSDTKKEFTNLPEGEYIFEVKSKNQYEITGTTQSFKFIILAPWYQTFWAYLGYTLLLMAIIYFSIKIYTRNLRMQKQKLEILVRKRTEEVEQQKAEIQQKNEELFATLELVNEQKADIEKAHHEITASIDYAKRIQQAVLPSEEMFKKSLYNHFILFRPRNIVSGDFYWIKKVHHITFLAIADCTGHGVPGAFMSMLGMSFLNEIVSKSSVDKTGHIMNNLRTKIKQTLKQHDAIINQKDGMDMIILAIDHDTLEMQYSGAYNSLYITREKQKNRIQEILDDKIEIIENENVWLFEFKADRQPVAVHIAEKEFTTQVFHLQKNDILYGGSDGFVDQIGGDRDKKFMSKKFKQLLLDIHDKPFENHKELLIKTLENWQGVKEQVDDILVIGVKV